MTSTSRRASSRAMPGMGQVLLGLAVVCLQTDAFAARPTGWGRDNAGQVSRIPAGQDLVGIAAGSAHGVALDSAGRVSGWGADDQGQATPPPDLGTVQSVAAGFSHSLALRTDGQVRAWGGHGAGQTAVPVGLAGVRAIAAGGAHSLALRTDGTIVAWGDGSYGQCEVPTGLSGIRSIAAGAYHSLAVTAEGQVVVWGFGATSLQAPPAGLSRVRTVASGFHHNIALREDGTVVAWGDNRAGQATVPPGLSDVVAVAAGLTHSLALRADGALVLWGSPDEGQLDSSILSGRVEAVAAGAGFSLALTAGPVLTRQPLDTVLAPGLPVVFESAAAGREPLQFQWQHNGRDVPGATAPTLHLANAGVVDEGRYRVVVRNADGGVRSREALLRVPPVIITAPAAQTVFQGANAALTVEAAGTAPMSFQWFQGTNALAQATQATLTLTNVLYAAAGDYRVVVANSVGAVTSAVARLEVIRRPSPSIISGTPSVPYDGTIGFRPTEFENARWQLNGQDAPGMAQVYETMPHARPSDSGRYRFVVGTPAGDVPTDEFEVAVEPQFRVDLAGRRVVLDAGDGRGTVRAFQWMHDGDSLPGATGSALVLDPAREEDSGEYTVALTDGLGQRIVRAAQVKIWPAPGVGRIAGWGNGAAQYPAAATIENAVGLYNGWHNGLFALLADGTSVRLADGSPGGGGSSDAERVVAATSLARYPSSYTLLFADGHASGITWGACFLCGSPDRFVAVAQGEDIGAGLLANGTVKVWGRVDPAFQPPAGLSGVTAISAGIAHVLVLRHGGTVVAWGANYWGECNTPPGLDRVRAIASGGGHNLALRDDGTVVAWGDNFWGQCNPPAGLRDAVAIFAGGSRSYAVRADGSLIEWGDTSQGQNNIPAGLRDVASVFVADAADFAIVGGASMPAILEQPTSVEREIGDSATFAVRAWATLALRYQWQRNGVDLPNATNATLTLTGVGLADRADYRVIVSTDAGNQTSRAAALWVNPAPFLQLPSTRGQVVGWGPLVPGGRTNYTGVSNIVALGSPAYADALFAETGWYANANPLSSPPFSYVGPTGEGVVDLTIVSRFEQRAVGLFSNGRVRVLGEPLPNTTVYEPLRRLDALRGIRRIAANFGPFIAIRSDGTVFHDADPARFSTQLTDVVDVAATQVHLAALTSDGRVVAARLDNLPDTIPFPAGLDQVSSLSGGLEHILALQRDGRVVAWGGNGSGQCDVPASLTNAIAVTAAPYGSFALRADRTLVAWGAAQGSTPLTVPSLTNVLEVASGGGASLALVAGPLITAPPVDVLAAAGGTAVFAVDATALDPIQCQWFHEGTPVPGGTNLVLTLGPVAPQHVGRYEVRLDSGGWQAHAGARLALGPPPELIEAPADQIVVEGAPAELRVRVQTAEAPGYQWFLNDQPLSGATSPDLRLASAAPDHAGRYRVRVSTPLGHELDLSARLDVVRRQAMGRLVAWGPGVAPAPELSGVVEVAVGRRHGLALLADGRVRAWGDASLGQLDVPADALDIVAIAAGNHHNLALRRDGRVVGWGFNSDRQATPPARADIVAIAAGGAFSLALTRAGNILFWGNPYGGMDALPEAATNVVALAAGDSHALALRADGTAVGWGAGTYGEATPPPDANRDLRAVFAGNNQSALLGRDGTVTVFGLNHEGQTNTPPGLRPAVDLALGSARTLVLLDDRTVAAWGQPGYADVPPGLTNVLAVGAGEAFNAAVVETGSFILESPSNREALAGEPVEWRVRAVGTLPLAYQWYKESTPIAGATTPVLLLPAAQSTDAGRYSVRVTTDLGSVASATATLTVRQPPLLMRSPANTLAWAGTDVRFESQVSGDSPLRYQWRFNGQTIAGQSSAVLTRSRVTTAQAGEYALVVTNKYGSRTAVARLAVLTPPPTNVQTYAGSPLQLEVTGSAPLTPSWQWYQDNQPIEGAAGPVLSLPAVAAPGGLFTVRFRLLNGPTLEASTRVDVASPAPQIAVQPADQLVAVGGTARFHVEATGEPPFTYQWRFNGQEIPGGTQPDLVLPSIDTRAAGRYAVRVANRHGAVDSAEARLEVGDSPNVVAWGTNVSGVLAVPPGLTNAVAVAASEHCLALTSDGRVVAWGANAYGQATVPADLGRARAVAAGATHSLALLDDGRVAAWGDNRFNQTNVPPGLSDVVALATSDLHSLALRRDGTVVGWGENSYGQTTPPAGLGRVAAIAAPAGASVALLADGTATNWGNGYYPPEGLSNLVDLVAGPSRVLARTTADRLVAWFWPGGTAVPEGPTNPVSYASGLWISNSPGTTWIMSHEVAALPGGNVVVWGANPGRVFTPPAGLTHVTAVAAGRWHNLAVVTAPVITTQPLGGTFATGSPVTLSVTAVRDTPHSFQWEFNGQPIPGATNASFVIPSLQIAQSGRYAVAVRGATHAVRSADATVRADTLLPAILAGPADLVVSPGGNASFAVEAIGREPLVYAWFRNGARIDGANGAILTLAKLDEAAAGWYEVRVSNEDGAVTSAPATLALLAPQVVLDDGQALLAGGWQLASDPAQQGTGYLASPAGAGQAYAEFRTRLPRSGRWNVSTRAFPTPTGAATPVLIISADGPVAAWSPAPSLPGWYALGEFRFDTGTDVVVRFLDAVADPTRFAVADAVRFTYLPEPPRLLRGPQSLTVIEGGPAEFTALAAGAAPLRYQWQFGDHNLDGATDPTLRLPSVRPDQTGAYRVLVVNLDGATVSPPAQLTVRAAGPELRADLVGQQLRLSWEGPGLMLQSAPQVPGPFVDHPGAASPVLVDLDEEPHRFFRLRR